MKVVGILGSTRPDGNTATLLRQVLEGAAAQGATTTTISTNNLTVHDCTNCDTCKRTGQCVLNDDMQEIYNNINESDVIILASPNYMGGIAGNLKLVIDRLYLYFSVTETGELRTTIQSPKKVALLITQNAPREYTHYREAFTPLRGVLHLIFQGNFDPVTESLVAPLLIASSMKGPDTVENDPQLLQEAYAFGADLALEG
ncbi:flavodoxin family protein [Methanosphaerula palustris]|uniref:NADPH-dependent FMN reductase n=1 Tax=Methanosphaerula palustris (strain ATCC BAA-1556 / DSM 19958 / E1-9c) TaxID=521011 RepID=B8GIJ4_METPE|nr:flavodoxin family protein [Methanosphaerula palustris]ACL16807.1 NADPH-dependent FMN reductase [Methanosphaerula palustris E1-9c]